MRDDGIKVALDRTVKAVTLRASMGKGTAVTKATLREGLSCDVTEGKMRFTAGMHEKYGGDDAGPNPGMLARGAIASCLAMGAAMWAARMQVPITALEVEVEADYDVRGELGVDSDVPAGYLAVRYRLNVTSPAPESKVRELLDTTIRTSSLVDDFARAIPVHGDYTITKG